MELFFAKIYCIWKKIHSEKLLERARPKLLAMVAVDPRYQPIFLKAQLNTEVQGGPIKVLQQLTSKRRYRQKNWNKNLTLVFITFKTVYSKLLFVNPSCKIQNGGQLHVF